MSIVALLSHYFCHQILVLAQKYNKYLSMSNQKKMFYEDFYIGHRQVDESDENNCFKAWQDSDPISEADEFKTFRKAQDNMRLTQCTFSQNQCSEDLKHFKHQIKSNYLQFNIENRNWQQKNAKPKNQRLFNTIQTSVYRIEKTVKSYIGQGNETVNLNKYFGKCMTDYLEMLVICHVIDRDQVEKYKESLRKGQISVEGLDQFCKLKCEGYTKSSHIISKLLKSTKMNFQNKIKAIKYIQKFLHKLEKKGQNSRAWKNSLK